MDWQYPVYEKEAVVGRGGSVAAAVRRSLSAEEAYAFIAGNDPRPLLILRECKVCNGTDKALLSPGADNEKTFLLSRWFHCVKLPMDVREEGHPFFGLFPEKEAEHLFVASLDGSGRIGLESEGSRTDLWKAMTAVLEQDYKDRPSAALKHITKLLDEFDQVDSRLRELTVRREGILEKDGPGARKLTKLVREITKLEDEKAELQREWDEAAALELRPRVAQAGD